MLTVNQDVSAVESDLAAGRVCCPGCRGVLRPWGWARTRRVRFGTGEGLQVVSVRPRRGRCTGCAGTHVLLGVQLAARRADAAAVIAAAIEAKVIRGARASEYRGLAGSAGVHGPRLVAWVPRLGCSDRVGVHQAGSPRRAGRGGSLARAGAGSARAGPGGGGRARRCARGPVRDRRAGVARGRARCGRSVLLQRGSLVGRGQHELALMPLPGPGQGGASACR